ncbi:hypothetical protein ABK040_009496 [Willaertia magna]
MQNRTPSSFTSQLSEERKKLLELELNALLEFCYSFSINIYKNNNIFNIQNFNDYCISFFVKDKKIELKFVQQLFSFQPKSFLILLNNYEKREEQLDNKYIFIELFTFPMIDIVWTFFVKNCKNYFGSGIYYLKIENGILFLKQLIYFTNNNIYINKPIQNNNLLQNIDLINEDKISQYCKTIIEEIANYNTSLQKKERHWSTFIIKFRNELTKREYLLMYHIIKVLNENLIFKEKPSTKDKILNFTKEWRYHHMKQSINNQ